MDEVFIEDLQINQRFILAGQTYRVINVDFQFDYNHYVVTARSEDRILYTMLEIKMQPRSPFTTLR